MAAGGCEWQVVGLRGKIMFSSGRVPAVDVIRIT